MSWGVNEWGREAGRGRGKVRRSVGVDGSFTRPCCGWAAVGSKRLNKNFHVAVCKG